MSTPPVNFVEDHSDLEAHQLHKLKLDTVYVKDIDAQALCILCEDCHEILYGYPTPQGVELLKYVLRDYLVNREDYTHVHIDDMGDSILEWSISWDDVGWNVVPEEHFQSWIDDKIHIYKNHEFAIHTYKGKKYYIG